MTQTDIKVTEPVIADGKMTEEQRKSSVELLDATVKAEHKPM